MLKLLCLSALALPLTAFAANPGTDTVPTNLLTSMYILVADSTNTTLTPNVDFEQLGAVNGVEEDTALDLSTDETMTFTGGGKTIAYTASTAPSLPGTDGGSYTANYKRYTGESFSATATMPTPVQFTAPAPNSVFKPTDTVSVAWTTTTYDEQAVIVSGNCDGLVNNVVFNDTSTGVTFPAGTAAGCTGTPEAEVAVANINMGSGFGLYGIQVATALTFTYNTSTTVPHMSVDEIAKYVRIAHKTGQHLFRIVRKN